MRFVRSSDSAQRTISSVEESYKMPFLFKYSNFNQNIAKAAFLIEIFSILFMFDDFEYHCFKGKYML